jgi:hypothetical protein
MSNFYDMGESVASQKISDALEDIIAVIRDVDGSIEICEKFDSILEIYNAPSNELMVCPIGSYMETICFQVKDELEKYHPLSKLLKNPTPEGILIWSIFWGIDNSLGVVSAKIQQEQEKYNECAEGFRLQYTIETLKLKHQAFILALDKKTEQAAALNAAIELLRGVSDPQIFDNEIEVLEMAFYANQKHKLCLIEEKTTTKIIAKIAFNSEL